MRLLGVWVLVAAFFTTVAVADLTELAAVLPKCALTCLVTGISESSCAVTNQTCICTDPTLNANVELCVGTSCTIREALTTKNITSTACGAPIRDRTAVISGTGLGGGIIALVVFLFRLVARLPYFGGEFGWDDATMVLTMALVIPMTALSVVLADLGLGKDMWTVPFDNITHILYIYYYDESIYLSILPLTKISILCFYLRIFPKRSFRIAVYVTIALNVGYLLAFVLISVFQCQPIHGAWDRWDGEHAFKCNNINAQGWAAAAINMFLDILVMALPLRELAKLSLSIRKKIFVMCMFSLGIFVTLVSILRLRSLIEFANTHNLTWDYVPLGYWSTIEVHVGVICACLPAMRSLLRRAFPSVFGGTTKGATGYSQGSMSRSAGTSSRLEGAILQKPKADDKSHFVPLVDMDNSSQAHLARS